MSANLPSLVSDSMAIAHFVMQFAKAVIIGPHPNPNSPISVNTASATLLELNAVPIAITCQHVVAEALMPVTNGKSKIFQIGDATIDLESQLIDQNVDLDIATIRLHKDQLPLILADGGIGPSLLFRPTTWPPVPPNEDDVIVFGGFPGTFRTVHSFNEITFGPFVNTASPVSSASERHFISHFERDYWDHSLGNPELIDTKILGGMSGGPVLVPRGLHFDLVGIVKEYQDSYDSMIFASLKWIDTDGRISYMP